MEPMHTIIDESRCSRVMKQDIWQGSELEYLGVLLELEGFFYSFEDLSIHLKEQQKERFLCLRCFDLLYGENYVDLRRGATCQTVKRPVGSWVLTDEDILKKQMNAIPF